MNEKTSVDGVIILKWILKNNIAGRGMDSSVLRHGVMRSSSVHGD
jgi:hypothetical protein